MDDKFVEGFSLKNVQLKRTLMFERDEKDLIDLKIIFRK
jgi:hypothetical protein